MQARTIGWTSYSAYQNAASKPAYSQALAQSSNPKEARKLDSPFNSNWAKNIEPRFRNGQGIGRDMWKLVFDDLGIEPESELYVRYMKGKE